MKKKKWLAPSLIIVLIAVIVISFFTYKKHQGSDQGDELMKAESEESQFSESSAHEDQERDQQSMEPESEELPDQEMGEAVLPEESEGPPKISVMDGELVSRDGETVRISDFTDKPMVINFWATWCVYCKKELPYFNKAVQKYGDQVNFLFITELASGRETKERVEEFLNSHDYDIPVYYDVSGDVTTVYQVPAYPATVFVKDKQIVEAFPGAVSEDIMDEMIQSLL